MRSTWEEGKWAKKLVGKLCREGLRGYCARMEARRGQAQWQGRVKKVMW